MSFAQTPKPAAPNPDEFDPAAVVMRLNGRDVTAGELDSLVAVMGAQAKQNFQTNRKEFVRQLGFMEKLAEMAEKGKLNYEAPYRDRLRLSRMQIMMQAQLDKAYENVSVDIEDQKKYYKEHADKYTQAKVRVIYVSFVPVPQPASGANAKKQLSEAEAKAKAEQLVKQLRGGADFAKLATENSDDPTSAAKGGEFGVIKMSDNIPDNIKKAVFALKTGQVGDPIRQPNGFYVFRADEVGMEPFDKVKEEIFRTIQEEGAKKWIEEFDKTIDVKVVNEAYFTPRMAPMPPAPAKP